jgi:formylglycine-generating enzyme required for sulfatase activity
MTTSPIAAPVVRALAFAAAVLMPPATSQPAFAAEPDDLRGVDVPVWVSDPGASFEITATEITVRQFRVCIDAGDCTLESLGETCNFQTGDRDDHPVNCASYDAAQDFCAHVSGRVCQESEWLEACRGQEDRAFPYGPDFDLGACNVQSTESTIPGRDRTTAAVAGHAACEGGYDGLYDMAGNVAEWVDPCKDDYCKFRGAGYLTNEPIDMFAACRGVCSGNDKSLRSGVIGIRCCRDTTP